MRSIRLNFAKQQHTDVPLRRLDGDNSKWFYAGVGFLAAAAIGVGGVAVPTQPRTEDRRTRAGAGRRRRAAGGNRRANPHSNRGTDADSDRDGRAARRRFTGFAVRHSGRARTRADSFADDHVGAAQNPAGRRDTGDRSAGTRADAARRAETVTLEAGRHSDGDSPSAPLPTATPSPTAAPTP